MKKKILITALIVIIIIVGFGIYYVNDYYHADKTALEYINGSENVTVSKIDNALFLNSSGDENALIFYPGAKIEYISYLPLLYNIANNNIDCFLVEMPFNLAIFNQNAADDIINNYNYTHYYIAGHSLGGSMAAQYVHNTNKTDGLILLASYPTNEIEKNVLSIYGSCDKILNMEKYNSSKSLMSNLTEIKLKGANHAQFGNYAFQSGDGKASISSFKQQKQTSDAIVDFIRG